jgi:hypothetical protein
LPKSLQQQFLESGGAPIRIDDVIVVQMDSVQIPTAADVSVKFIGDSVYSDNAVILAIRKPGRIRMSDGSWVTAIEIWDEANLPREVVYRVRSDGQPLMVHNKYRVRHSAGFVTEDNFTGNAAMVVTTISRNRKLYECSNGLGHFDKRDLVFELEWEKVPVS